MPSYDKSNSILFAEQAFAEILYFRPTRKMVQWWYTCRKDSCLQDFFITMKIVSMKSRTCFGMVKEKRRARSETVKILSQIE